MASMEAKQINPQKQTADWTKPQDMKKIKTWQAKKCQRLAFVSRMQMENFGACDHRVGFSGAWLKTHNLPRALRP